MAERGSLSVHTGSLALLRSHISRLIEDRLQYINFRSPTSGKNKATLGYRRSWQSACR